MESFSIFLLAYNVIAYGLDPKLSVGFEKFRIVNQKFEYKHLHVQILRVIYLLKQSLHEYRKTGSVLFPFFRKKLLHFVERSLDVFHTFMFVHFVYF